MKKILLILSILILIISCKPKIDDKDMADLRYITSGSNSANFEEYKTQIMNYLDKYPGNSSVIFNVGRYYFFSKDFDKAYSYIYKSLKKDKNSVQKKIWLSKVLIEKKEYDSAKTFLYTVISNDPENIEANLLLLKISVDEGDYELSLQYSKILQKYSELIASGLMDLSYVYFSTSNHPEGLSLLRKAALFTEDGLLKSNIEDQIKEMEK
jgi:lipopolysaccharide biosynthesis regulator YciM